MNPTLDINWVRKQFPALSDNFIFMDNAGGSQVAGKVITYLQEYFLQYNVQLGASYKISDAAGQVLRDTTRRISTLIHANRYEEIVMGSSATMVLRILSLCLSQLWKSGDEVIVSHADHEANVSCWKDLSKLGIVIKIWHVNKDTMQLEIEDLLKILSKKTKLVAMVHASNVLGTIHPVKNIAKIVHEVGALLCVDGVAYAPHRSINVKEWDVDFYVFSTYKIYGPHQAVLYGKYELLEKMPGINHFFIQSVPYKFQPGNFNFELMYSLNGICDYLEDLAEYHYPSPNSLIHFKDKNEASFSLMAGHEENLSDTLLSYLNSKPEIRIIGSKKSEKDIRVPTISFVHKYMRSDEIVSRTDAYHIGIRYGDFYAVHLIDELGLREKNGVVRVSMVHYNTIAEVHRLIDAFDEIL